MEHKLRADSTLAKLNQDQLDHLSDWCSEHGFAEVQELAAKPAPEGFGLKIHKTTLARFFRDETKRRHAEELSQLAAGGADFNSQLATQNSELANLIRAARTDFAHAVYELSQAASEPENFDRLGRALNQLDTVAIRRDHLALKEKEFDFARERFEFEKIQWQFNAARVALDNAAGFKDILNNDQTDNEDKIWQAREVCFGELPPHLDTLKHTTSFPARSEVPPLPDSLTSACPATAGLPSVQGPVSIQPSSLNLQPPRSDTLKHTTPERSEVPPPRDSSISACPATAGLPSVQGPVSIQPSSLNLQDRTR